jgi:uncharacterized peroxidase-related enzyme
MSRIAPAALESLTKEEQGLVRTAEQVMGFPANDVLLLARLPNLLESVSRLTINILYAPGKVDASLKHMVGYITSTAAGCVYCGSHTFLSSIENGIPREKLDEIWMYDENEIFNPAERAALRLAHHAGLTPNASTDEDFTGLRAHFNEEEILEIVSVIALFGFLNRWNDTLKTDIEAKPRAAAAAEG